MTQSGEGRRVRGQVRGPEGAPIVGARVVVARSPVPLPDIAALTDAAGRFDIAVPTAGTYVLAAHADGMPGFAATAAITIPPAPIKTMPPGGTSSDPDSDVGSDDTPVDAVVEGEVPAIDVVLQFPNTNIPLPRVD